MQSLENQIYLDVTARHLNEVEAVQHVFGVSYQFLYGSDCCVDDI